MMAMEGSADGRSPIQIILHEIFVCIRRHKNTSKVGGTIASSSDFGSIIIKDNLHQENGRKAMLACHCDTQIIKCAYGG